MAIDPATLAALTQAIRLGSQMVGDAARLLERVQQENRDPTPEELLVLDLRREDVDTNHDAMLRARGIEPGTGRRI